MPIIQISPKTAQAEQYRLKGLYEAAIPLYREAIREDDNNVTAWAGLGFSCWKMNQVPEAEIAFRVCLGLNPIHDLSLFTFIEMLMSCEKLGLADGLIKHAEKHFGEIPAVWIAKGNMAIKRHQPKLAEKQFRKILAKLPREGATWMSLGSAKMHQHQFKEALECYRKAVFYEPQPDYIFNLGLAELLTGDYENGYKHYEASAIAYPHKYYTRLPKEKQWKGQPCKKLLIVHAHGLGDLIFLSRFFSQLPPFVLEVEWWQECLFKGIETSKRFYTGEYDYWIGEDSISGVIGARPCPPVDLFGVTEDEKAKARDLLGDKPAISFTWRGNPTYRNDLDRSIDLKLFKDVIESHPEYQFVNVSNEDFMKEIAESSLPVRQIQGDLRQSIAIISQCKKVLSVDTAHCHMGGTMGIETLMLNRFIPDWRWGLGDSCPWYPSVKIYRQDETGSYTEALEKVKQDL
jgi:tetratricopeptide (TPR) repeat protein